MYPVRLSPDAKKRYLSWLEDGEEWAAAYILREENDDETKALLAYRLTGRMRPKKLDTIIWFKEKGEPKELYYIIKYFSPRTQKKYSKQMKDYFENDYFGVADYSRTAEDVSDDFKDKLEDLFPGLTNTSKG